MTTSDDYWRVARDVCTARQIQTLLLRDKHLSLRQIALALDMSISTVRSTLFEADRKIELALRTRKEPAA